MQRSITILLLLVTCGIAVPSISLYRPNAPARGRAGRTDPREEPDKFAWEVFVSINKSAATPGNNNVFWETWADPDRVYGDPNHTPTWPDNDNRPLRFQPIFKQLFDPPSTRPGTFSQELLLREFKNKRQGIRPFFTPGTGSQLNEVRMNRAAFDFVVDNQLWYLQGQEEAFKDGKKLAFPKDAKEIKAVWKQIDASQKSRYHWQVGSDGKTIYGLIALHVTTKNLPNWLWATFEHVDNPQRCKELPCRDTFGIKNNRVSPDLLEMFRDAGMGPEWRNYRLDGTQIDFTDSGKPTLLGNSEMESSFIKTSSCITCHDRSTIDAQGNSLKFFKPVIPTEGYIGAPKPGWFSDRSGRLLFLKRDFVWSLMLAQSRNVAEKGPSHPNAISFAKDIKPLFRPVDIQHMRPIGVLLDDYDYMSQPANAKKVYDHLTGAQTPIMPPDKRWSKAQTDRFKDWMEGGYKP
jgi:hypothetical protein